MPSQSLERTRTWIESVGADESIRSHSPRARPTWLPADDTEPYPDDELPKFRGVCETSDQSIIYCEVG